MTKLTTIISIVCTITMLFGMADEARADITTGLISHWTFNDADVTDKVYDVSGNNNHGYVVNNATSSVKTSGILGEAFTFDGINDQVTMFSSAAVAESLTNMTVALWAKNTVSQNFNVLAAKYLNGRGWIFYVHNGGGAGRYGLLTANPTNYVSKFSAVSGLNDGQWHHVVAVATSTGNNVMIYIDGAAVALTDDSSEPPITGGFSSLGQPIRLGDIPQGEPYQGELDDVRIYDRELSAADIAELYQYTESVVVTPSRVIRLRGVVHLYGGTHL